MVKLQVNGSANIVSMLPINEDVAQKIVKNPNIIENMLKDLHASHCIEVENKQQYSCFGCGVENDKVNDLEERITVLKDLHKSFIEMVEDLPNEEEQKEKAAIDEIIKLLKEAKEKAAKNGMGLTAFLDNDEDMHYFGYMPPRIFMLTKLPIILSQNSNE